MKVDGGNYRNHENHIRGSDRFSHKHTTFHPGVLSMKRLTSTIVFLLLVAADYYLATNYETGECYGSHCHPAAAEDMRPLLVLILAIFTLGALHGLWHAFAEEPILSAAEDFRTNKVPLALSNEGIVEWNKIVSRYGVRVARAAAIKVLAERAARKKGSPFDIDIQVDKQGKISGKWW